MTAKNMDSAAEVFLELAKFQNLPTMMGGLIFNQQT